MPGELNPEDGKLAPFFGGYSTKTANDLENCRFGRPALGRRAMGYAPLDQLTVEVLLGVR